nr:immunoglobulin heavy chain junction region [Macaca mulatta]MOX15937.1 immunoglobulin heavy chain junction region [Macaca mulatta]MOX16387.1 immunoglobulin heavy chain junction region [Macaca mulatta]
CARDQGVAALGKYYFDLW